MDTSNSSAFSNSLIAQQSAPTQYGTPRGNTVGTQMGVPSNQGTFIQPTPPSIGPTISYTSGPATGYRGLMFSNPTGTSIYTEPATRTAGIYLPYIPSDTGINRSITPSYSDNGLVSGYTVTTSGDLGSYPGQYGAVYDKSQLSTTPYEYQTTDGMTNTAFPGWIPEYPSASGPMTQPDPNTPGAISPFASSLINEMLLRKR